MSHFDFSNYTNNASWGVGNERVGEFDLPAAKDVDLGWPYNLKPGDSGFGIIDPIDPGTGVGLEPGFGKAPFDPGWISGDGTLPFLIDGGDGTLPFLVDDYFG